MATDSCRWYYWQLTGTVSSFWTSSSPYTPSPCKSRPSCSFWVRPCHSRPPCVSPENAHSIPRKMAWDQLKYMWSAKGCYSKEDQLANSPLGHSPPQKRKNKKKKKKKIWDFPPLWTCSTRTVTSAMFGGPCSKRVISSPECLSSFQITHSQTMLLQDTSNPWRVMEQWHYCTIISMLVPFLYPWPVFCLSSSDWYIENWVLSTSYKVILKGL